MAESPAEVCRRFGYPALLEEVLSTLAEASRRAFPDLRSLVLSGSTCTGDFVWRSDGSKTRLLSDIDAFLFVDGRPHPRPEFQAVVERLERAQASPLFHIDVSISRSSALRRLPRQYQMVESGLSGIVLAGRDVLPSFPRQFDSRGPHESFFWNLWKGILAWPGAGGGSEEIYLLALARLILDAPLLAFSEGGMCIPGHRARAEAFLELGEGHRLADEQTRRAVRLALQVRERGDVRREQIEPLVLPLIDRVLDYLDGGAAPPRDPSPELVRRIRRLLPPRSPRRLLGELRSVVQSPHGLGRDAAWLLRRKEAVGGAALLGLLAFVLGGAEGRPPPGIAERLGEFTGGIVPTGEGGQFVVESRRVYWNGCCRLSRSAKSKDAFFQRLIETT
jgi:hypothetical protein